MKKEFNKIYIKDHHSGSCRYILPILELIFKNKEIIFISPDSNLDYDISYFPHHTTHYDEKKPFIIAGHENFINDLKNHPNCIAHFISIIPEVKEDNVFYLPYFLDRNNLNDVSFNRKYNNKKNNLAVYVAKNNVKNREDFFNILRSLDTTNTVDALGEASHTKNVNLPSRNDWHKLPEIYKDYKFTFAMENSDINGYITEKIMNAYIAGSIPIYWGTSKVKTIFNPKSFIYLNDYNSFEEAAKDIISISNDNERYNAMINEPIFISNLYPEYDKYYDKPPPQFVIDIANSINNNLKKYNKIGKNMENSKGKQNGGNSTRKQKGGNSKKIYVRLTGGLGNRLFQIFAAYGFAEKWGNYEVILLKDGKYNHVSEDNSLNDFKQLFPQLKQKNNSNNSTNISKLKIINDNSSYENPNNSIILDGFFQNSSFFPTNEIKLHLLEPTNNIIKNIDKSHLYFIHFRFGDFKYSNDFKINLIKYYTFSINQLKNSDNLAKFIIISDDINNAREYISNNLKLDLNELIFDNNTSRLDSLYYMSQCVGGICSNSTFSWWGAYSILNKNPKTIFMPSKWQTKNIKTQGNIVPTWVTKINLNSLNGGSKKRRTRKIRKQKGGSSIDFLPFINDNFIVWTLTSNGYKDVTYNLYNSIKKSNISWKLMIVCLDNESHNYFKEKNIESIFYKSESVSTPNKANISTFKSESFMDFNRIKLELIEKIRLEAPEQVKYILYMDGDIVVFKDFMPYLIDLYNKNNTPHLYFQGDNYGGEANSVGCSGFFIMDRFKLDKSPFIVHDDNEWKQIREDQLWINKYLNEYKIPFGYLDRPLFPNGAYMYNNSQEWKTFKDAYILHYNFMVGQDKIKKMKENNHWYI